MALSKSTRIIILLSIDSAFFLLELLVGYSVHSLALVADSFHMLNDVISLCVGLWAVKVANQKTSSKMYTYGWQRAETLGALLNGVFLVALCLSIFLEAVQRFFEPQSVKNPKLVLIVGCCGLASNILGLFLFHEHGHSHGGHDHTPPAPIDQLIAAEEGHNNPPTAAATLDEVGNIEDILTFNTVYEASVVKTNASGLKPRDASTRSTSPISTRRPAGQRHRRRTSGSRSGPFASVDDINIHPASFRNDIIAAGRLEDIESATATDVSDIEYGGAENTPLLCKVKSFPRKKSTRQNERHDSWHVEHNHNNKPEKDAGGEKGHSHHHGDLNMKGILLHVMGDALGNIGVIGSALIIWLTNYEWRYYSDPIISLIITMIILASAIPLCLAASRILLQAVPAGISVDDIKADIQELPGIKSCHHLHVWQLSDTKLVASLHVEVDYDFEGAGSAHYMELARAVRKCLHAYGIHSSTIQPEFCLKKQGDSSSSSNSFDGAVKRGGGENGNPATKHNNNNNNMGARRRESRPGSPNSTSTCLLECGDECGVKNQCCAPATETGGDSQADNNNHTH